MSPIILRTITLAHSDFLTHPDFITKVTPFYKVERGKIIEEDQHEFLKKTETIFTFLTRIKITKQQLHNEAQSSLPRREGKDHRR